MQLNVNSNYLIYFRDFENSFNGSKIQNFQIILSHYKKFKILGHFFISKKNLKKVFINHIKLDQSFKKILM